MTTILFQEIHVSVTSSNGRISGSHFSPKLKTLCFEAILCCSSLVSWYAAAVDQPHLFLRVTLRFTSPSLFAGAGQGMSRASLPAGMAAFSSLLSSKEEFCSLNRSRCLTLAPGECCHTSTPCGPLHGSHGFSAPWKDLFYPLQRDRVRSSLLTKIQRNVSRRNFKALEDSIALEKNSMNVTPGNIYFTQSYCHLV